ncbi:MAG: hypothetical protein QNJ29_05760 [Rhizobiaceae bacterium]|nr:hypothetical protein [Rhizobiaceae bacterium]
MTMSNQSDVNLIEKIEQAFADVQYPGDDNLTDSNYGEEPSALAIEFRGKTDWKQLDTAFLNQAPDGWGSALSFFSDSALRFYLPAYLIANIQDGLEFCPASILCSSLTPSGEKVKIAKMWGGGTMGDRARICFDKFNAEQVSAVIAYLWWELDTDGDYDMCIEQALENYWLQREAAFLD